MINLIPKEEKKKMAKVFYYKLIILLLVTLGISILIVFVGILPSYFLASSKNNIISAKLAAQEAEPVPIPDQETLAVIKDLNNKLNLIEKAESNKFSISQKVINAIILSKMSSIKITDISYQNDPAKDPLSAQKISIQGIAPSREVLLLFSQALQNNGLFKNVDLPISNFVKGSNIEFSLSLISA